MSRHRIHDADHESDLLTPPLADAVDRLRAESPDPERVRHAADRVWRRLAAEAAATAAAEPAPSTDAEAEAGRIAGCTGFQSLIPAYLAGELSPERRLLLEDHSRECVPCRRALTAARRGEAQPAAAPATAAAAAPATAAPAPRRALSRWLAVAAALIAVVGLAGYLTLAPHGAAAVVEAADGALLRVAPDGAVTALATGAELAEGETVRTARDGGAVVRLADGSAVELAAGTELAVGRGLFDSTIRLGRGNVIVEAAKRSRGHLYVATDDCRVAVTGTIFAVNHGVNGSRVSVIEGEVRVASNRGQEVLRPGEQTTTRTSLTGVPVSQEIAWSRHSERYLDLLRELTAVARAIEERVERPELRYTSELAPIAPAATAAYLGMPNLSGQVAESYQVFREQLATSPVLAAWWAENAEAQAHVDRLVTVLHDFGGYLGDEVAVAFVPDPAGDLDGGGPVVLATVVRSGFGAYLEQEAAQLEAEAGHPVLVPVADPHAAPAGTDALLVWPGEGLMIASPDPGLLAAAADAAAGSAPGLAGTALYERLTEAYEDGVEWLFVGDFGVIAEGEADPTGAVQRQRIGIADLEYVVVEHRGVEGAGLGGRAQTSAELSFSGPRRGLASWLAAPAPMGSLAYVSPDATAAFAAVLKEPAAMFDDLLAVAIADDPDAGTGLAEARTELGIDPREDLAAALGGEIAFAIDGPLLPEPSWKLIVEVTDPERLQASIETLVDRLAEESEAGGGPAQPVTLEPEAPIGGAPAWRLAGAQGFEAHYVYSGGYLVAAPSRALVARALDQRTSGASLTASAGFRELVPADPNANFSALVYQHLGPAVAPLADALSNLSGEVDPAQVEALTTLAAESEPTLMVAFGEPEAIRFVATNSQGAFGLGYSALLGVGGLSALAEAAHDAETVN